VARCIWEWNCLWAGSGTAVSIKGGGAWQKNEGIRIDHALLSPQATDRLLGCRIDKQVRGWEKPFDHVPVVIELDA
jgi:exonuclease III